MADVDFSGFDGSARMGGPGLGGGAHRMMQMTAAVVSVALVAGMCVWGYRLAVRDVTGIPVVRAMEGPMRVAPADPGGTIAAHQGLAVNDVAADGSATATADRLVLAPPPVALTVEDAAGTVAAPNGPVSARTDTSPAVLMLASAESDDAGIALAVAEAMIDDAEPLAGTLEPVAAAAPVTDMPQVLPAGFVRPMPRPARYGGSAAQVAVPEVAVPEVAVPEVAVPEVAVDPVAEVLPTDVAATPSETVEIDPTTLKTGTRLAQLGAFETVADARIEWDKLALRFGGTMAGKGRVIEAAQSGGRTFYRLRAHGFDDETAARRFCAAFLTKQTACIPVTQR